MHLSKRNAEEIVKEINTIINWKINIMNEKGIIIASSDKERVGQLHQGALAMIEQNLDELLITPDNSYEGSSEGANYPVILQGKLVGVVGITGPCEEVTRYGKITKKLTEILLQELSIKEQKALDESLKWRYLGEWLQNENLLINKNFVDRGLKMGFDITLPRRFMIVSAYDTESDGDTLDSMRKLEQAERKVKALLERKSPDAVYFKIGSSQICGVSNCPDKEMRKIAEEIKGTVETQTGLRVAIGIDDKCHAYTMANISYTKANKALQSSLRSKKYNVCFYGDINMEIFTDEISDLSKKEYVQKLFKNYTLEEITEAINILEMLYEVEGSITKVSEVLHMHKNTLQYKLKRIYEKTGYDPRSLRDSALFYIAIYFFREIRELFNED